MVENRKRLVANFMSLGFQQGITILFPLLIFPYLLRILGISGFGVFTLIQTGIMYFDLLIAFGFGLTATKRIATAKDDLATQKKIIAGVYIIQLLLFITSLIGILVCSLFIPYLQQNIMLLLLAALYLLGNLLFPDWYFRGIQQMKNCTLVTLISKLISFVLIIVLVRQPTDITNAFFALAAGNVLAGITGFFLLQHKVKLSFKLPEKTFVAALFEESSYVFASIILAPFYSSVNIFILQFFASPLMVGSYSIAQKIYNAATMLTGVVNNSFFPHLSQQYATSVADYKKSVQKLLVLIGSAFFILAAVQFFGAALIIQILVGNNSGEDISYAITILRIISFALLFSPFVSFFFQQMIIQGQQKAAIKNIVAAVVINLVTAVIFSYWYGGIGMAVNVCLVTVLICFLNAASVNKKIGLLQGS